MSARLLEDLFRCDICLKPVRWDEDSFPVGFQGRRRHSRCHHEEQRRREEARQQPPPMWPPKKDGLVR